VVILDEFGRSGCPRVTTWSKRWRCSVESKNIAANWTTTWFLFVGKYVRVCALNRRGHGFGKLVVVAAAAAPACTTIIISAATAAATSDTVIAIAIAILLS